MRFLDTREQKSPRFLIDAFPDIEIKPLTVGDYFSGENKTVVQVGVEEYKVLMGNLVEIKIGPDFGIHTEQLERFQDELYRMSCYRQQNPHVQLHAVWVPKRNPSKTMEQKAAKIIEALRNIIYRLLFRKGEERHFFRLCFQYHVWGHVKDSEEELIDFLKKLDQPSQYKEFEPYIKRSHEEPTILAKMLRQFPGISSEKAIALEQSFRENAFPSMMSLFYPPADEVHDIVVDTCLGKVLGVKKDGELKKLAVKFKHWMETGESP